MAPQGHSPAYRREAGTSNGGDVGRETFSFYSRKGQREPALSVGSGQGRARTDRRAAGEADGTADRQRRAGCGAHADKNVSGREAGERRAVGRWFPLLFCGGAEGGREEGVLSFDCFSLSCLLSVQVAVITRMSGCWVGSEEACRTRRDRFQILVSLLWI